MGTGRRLIAALLALAGAVEAHAESMQIRFAEPVQIPAAADVQFEAYGRHFALALENNERLLSGMAATRKAQLPTIRLLRGKLDGQAGSWVRLTSKGDYVSGAIWDGMDLYLIAPYREVATFLVNPLTVDPAQTVVFRLSDTLNFLPPNFCATGSVPAGTAANNGLVQYKALLKDLKLQFVSAPTDQIDISMIADSALGQMYASSSPPSNDVRLAMLSTLNVVDGIYDAQLGLMISASLLQVMSANTDPFTATQASPLLAQLRTYRNNTPEVRSRAIAHLFTSHILDDGGVLGIAHLGGACDDTNGVSLTSAPGGLLSAASFIMAHEIGHNLGAEHDTAACGDNFLMWPQYSAYIQPRLSQCSLDQIRPFIVARRGSCVAPALYGDAEARIGTIPSPLRTEAFVWPVFLRNVGTGPLTDAELFITLQSFPGTINSVTPTSGSCVNQSGTLRCSFSTLVPGAEARVDLNLTPTSIWNLQLQLRADGSNDRYENNNFAGASVEVLPNAVLAVSVSPATRTAVVGETVSYTFTLDSRGPRVSPGVSIRDSFGSDIRFSAAVSSRGSCVVANLGLGFSCDIGDIPAGQQVTVDIQGHAIQAKTITVGGTVTAGAYMASSSASATLIATATRDVGIDLGSTYRVLAVGVPTDMTFPIRAYGTQPIENVVVRFYPSNAPDAVNSVDVNGAACPKPTNEYRCTIGTMYPGETRVLRVNMRFSETPQIPANTYLQVSGDGDELFANDQGNVLVTARAAVDLAVSDLTGTSVFEGQTVRLGATLRSAGIDAANNVSVNFEVPAPLEVRAGTLQQGTCVVANPRKLTCTRASLAAAATATVSVDVFSADPGTFTGQLTSTADNDGIPENNVFDMSIYYRPLTDVGIRPIPRPPAFVFGRSYTLSFEVFTGARPVPYVDARPPSFGQMMIIDSVTTTAGTCPWPMSSADVCHLGALPANATVTITMTMHPVGTGFGGGGSSVAMASTGLDSDHSNDIQWVDWRLYTAGDVRPQVAAASVTGRNGERLVLPTISLNTLIHSEEGTLEIPLPSFATVESVTSPGGMCTGTTTLKCYFNTRDAGMTDNVDITLRINGTGTFTSTIVGTSANDTNSANDSATLSITANPASSSSGGGGGVGGGGGGGGGRIEWPVVILLGLLLIGRQRRREPARPAAP